MQRWLEAIPRWIVRHAVFVLVVTGGLGVVGAHYSIELFKNLRTDVEELLPTTARSVVDLKKVTSRLESTESLALLIFTKDMAAGRKYVDDLVAELRKIPRDVCAGVEYRISETLDFFERRRALFLSIEDLTRSRDYIRDRIDYERELYNPLNIFRSNELPEPNLDFAGMKRKYEGKVSAYASFPDGYYAMKDGSIRAILLHLPGKLSGIDGAHHLRDAAQRAIHSLNAKSYAPDLEVKFTGGVQNLIEEHASLIADLMLGTIIVTILCAIGMIVYYRSWRTTTALLVALFVGTFWTFGLSYFLVGYLNANSAFLGSIVIGNGINFGIISLARYTEERRKRVDNETAIVRSMTGTFTATLTAALAAALAYGSLMLTSFRGFSQFGVIGLIGMLLCWVSAYTVQPALLAVIFGKNRSSRAFEKTPTPIVAGAIARLIEKRAGTIWAVSLILAGISITTFVRFSPNIIESDLSKLRDKESMTHGSGYLSQYLDRIFQKYMSPIVALPNSQEQAAQVATALRELKKKQGADSLIGSVLSIEEFVPLYQDQKISLLRDIHARLTPSLMKHVGESERALVKGLLTADSFRSFTAMELPELVRQKFSERDGSLGKLVVIEPPITDRLLQAGPLNHFIADLRGAVDSIEPGIPLAGQLAVSSDMIAAISRDGPKATLFAFVAVILLAVLIFRSFGTVMLILFALMLGVLWLAGAILGFGLKINFLNFIALPITFGIGVDYGVNVFQRFRQEGPDSILRVIRETGGAVMLASFTTITGYASLLIAGNQAFVSFGVLAVVGELTCIVAAVVALPAFIVMQSQAQQKPASKRK